MKVFISWSGEVSREFASAFADWLPNVIQAVEPFFSSEDIRKGSRWFHEIGDQLEQTNFGILCVTPENSDSPWLLFEAGALAKRVKQAHVSPLLLGLNEAQLKGPLAQFQCTVASEDDLFKLVKSMNEQLGEKALPESRLKTSFNRNWKDLEDAIGKCLTAFKKLDNTSQVTSRRSPDDMLEEILNVTRGLGRQLEEMRLDTLRSKVDLFSTNADARLANREYLDAVAKELRKSRHPAVRGLSGLLGTAEEVDEALPIKPVGGAASTRKPDKDK